MSTVDLGKHFMDPDQLMFRDSVRSYLRREVIPHIQEFEAKQQFPIEVLSHMGRLGFLNVAAPFIAEKERRGYLESVILAEELARVAGGLSSGIMTHCIGARMLARLGNADQEGRLLLPALEGSKICAIAITEPEHGSNVGGITTRATKSSEGWRLSGQKTFITNAPHADIFITICRGQSGGKEDLSMFAVESNTAGLRVGEPTSKLGWHTSEIADVYFDDCLVPPSNLLGTEKQGFSQLMKGFSYERIVMAGMGVGSAQAALDEAHSYASQRIQFSQPISKFQAIRHKLADMITELAAARALTYCSASAIDQGITDTGLAAATKLFTSEAANNIAESAVQVFGGAGFLSASAVSRIYRDVRVLTIGGGTSEIMRSVIAKESGI